MGVQKNTAKAVEWLEKAANQGIKECQHDLAVMYDAGTDIKRDLEKAFSWYKKAAERGYMVSQYSLAVMYESGDGIEVDNSKAIVWYKRAAEQGLNRSQFNLAVMYEKGKGTPVDMRQAFYWYKKAAENGLTNAFYIVGQRYELGTGVERDNQQALHWYEKGAKEGFINAIYSAGVFYTKGRGIKQDYCKGLIYFEKAAKRGYAPAQYNLANKYYEGQCVPKSIEMAKFWYNAAALQAQHIKDPDELEISAINSTIDAITTLNNKDNKNIQPDRYSKNNEEKDDYMWGNYCNSFANIAEYSMEKRQNYSFYAKLGVKKELKRIVNMDNFSQLEHDFVMHIIDEAFAVKRYDSAEERATVISNFSNNVYNICTNEFHKAQEQQHKYKNNNKQEKSKRLKYNNTKSLCEELSNKQHSRCNKGLEGNSASDCNTYRKYMFNLCINSNYDDELLVRMINDWGK